MKILEKIFWPSHVVDVEFLKFLQCIVSIFINSHFVSAKFANITSCVRQNPIYRRFGPGKQGFCEFLQLSVPSSGPRKFWPGKLFLNRVLLLLHGPGATVFAVFQQNIATCIYVSNMFFAACDPITCCQKSCVSVVSSLHKTVHFKIPLAYGIV